MKRAFVVCILLSTLFIPQLLSVASVVIFGPQRFNRTTGAPNEYTVQFALPAGVTSPYTMHVVNGAPNGSNRVSSATIKLNGSQILGPSDFNQQVGVIDRTVSLIANNVLYVKLASKPGSYLTININGQGGITIPVLSITQPADGSITKTSPVSVVGTVTGTTPIIVTANPEGTGGSPMAVNTNGVVNGQVALVEGINNINFIATDATGGRSTIVRRVTLDSHPPIVNLTSPIDNLITNQTSVTVSGTVTDSTTVTVNVNGTNVPVSNGSFSISIALVESVNTITIVATDATGNQTTVTRSVTRDSIPPTLIVTTPTDSTITNQTNITLSGTVTDVSATTLTVNDSPVQVGTNGSFNSQLALVEGSNTITVVATDAAGNKTTVTRTVRRDTQAPIVDLRLPIDNFITNQQTVVVSGTVIDSTTITLTINGIVVAIGSDGTFSAQIILVAGLNTITVVATDTAGNSSTITRTVTQSSEVLPPDPATVAPALDLTVPTTVAAATEFLYTGSNPIQKDVEPGTIEPQRVAVIRGKVLTRSLAPLPGVKITILNHPEFGYTLSRADGMFDLAVNGGGYLTIDYQKDGYIPLQRQIDAPWQDYVTVDSVVMIQLDPAVTTINFSDSIEVARGSVVTDQRGSRRATLFFRKGTVAKMIKKNYVTQTIQEGCNTRTIRVLTDSTVKVLSTMSVRATEYTVGATGLQAMPAQLPPASAYTYCVELSADEAIAMKADAVVFNKPVSVYQENFLGFPTGTIVPVGYYDNIAGKWIPQNNGRVIQVLGAINGVAQIDLDGDNTAEVDSVLEANQFDLAEREKLASLYPVGQSLWRTLLSHFSPGDMNFPSTPDGPGLPPEIDTPNPDNGPGLNDPLPGDDGSGGDDGGGGSCTTCDCPQKPIPGSIVSPYHQTLGENIGINGTPYNLIYQSDRGRGNKASYQLNIRVSGDTLPEKIKRMDVVVEIAGRTFTQSYLPAPHVVHHFMWDGKDALGRLMQGVQHYQVMVGYVYNSFYVVPGNRAAEFGLPPSTNSVLVPSTNDYIAWATYGGSIGSFDVLSYGIGGWTMNVQHSYNPNTQTLHFGDGRSQNSKGLSGIIDSVSGTRGGGETWMTVSPEGVIYFSHSYDQKVFRRCIDGTVSLVAGTGEAGYSGDGGLAINANLSAPSGLALDKDGNLYIADADNHCIRRITRDGIITTVAGNGTSGYSGDGGTAIAAQLSSPNGIAFGPDGNLYIADVFNGRVRCVTPSGMIYTIAGTGEFGYNGDGILAVNAQLNFPTGVAVGKDGSAYIADYSNGRIRKVTTDGIIRTIAGTGDYGYAGDGGPAINASLEFPNDVAVAANGCVFISDFNNDRIRMIDQGGNITTFAGSGSYDADCDGDLALVDGLDRPLAIALGPDNTVYLSDHYWEYGGMSSNNVRPYYGQSMRVRQIKYPFPSFSAASFYLPSANGSKLYLFDSQGKHLQTVDALTGILLYGFSYNNKGLLVSITDRDSLVTTIERDTVGKPLAIVSPFGQKTSLQINPNGYLSAVCNPAHDTTRFTYTNDGLMTSLTDPKLNSHYFEYDSTGRLRIDIDPAGGFTQLERTELTNGFEVTATTAEGRRKTYHVESIPTGGTLMRNSDDNGLSTEFTYKLDGTSTIVSSNGTVTNTVLRPDPRFGMLSPLATTTTSLPSGMQSTVEHYRTISQMTGLTVTGMTEEVVINYRTYTSVYDGEQKLFINTSPEGRMSYSWFDTKGRTIKDSVPGIEATYYSYDPKGRLMTVSQAGRTASYTYDAKSYLATATDPIQRTSRFEYDSVGRITRQVLPDNHEILYSYDANGNLTTLTPPTKPAHAFDYNKVDLTTQYAPPILGADTTITRYEYNKDKQILKVIRPDGGVIETIYDSVGCSTCGSPVSRPKKILFDRGELDFKYSQFTGKLDTLIAPSDTTTYSYDGSLVISISKIGLTPQHLNYYYDQNFRVTDQELWVPNQNGEDFDRTTEYWYDQDGLVTNVATYDNYWNMVAPWMSISYDPSNGRPISTSLGNMFTGQTYNEKGELDSFEADYNGSAVFHTNYGRDSLGRITELQEMVDGKTEKKNYAYDIAGRLEKVWRDDTLISTYSYDPNGNRVSRLVPLGSSASHTDSATYDAQDRMLSYGSAQYVYTRNGELNKKIIGADTTCYTYDYFGNLVDVRLSNGDLIEYIIDGQNRRISKKLNGQIVKRWIYSGQLSPIAELDSAGNVVAQFVGNYMIKNSNTYQLITDHLGSVRLVVDVNTGDVAQKLEYDEFGNVLSNTNLNFQPFGYAGGLYDSQTKLVRFGVRDYDAYAGRWTIKDPIGFLSGGFNLYTYVSNDPLNWIDPNGLIKYTATAGKPVDAKTQKNLECFEKCTGKEVTVTAGKEGGHAEGSAHEAGEACDIGKNSNPSLTRETAEKCFKECFPQTSCYAQEESNHFHFQTRPGKGGAVGFAVGIK
jgi:RHS repeat-associated protein